jgi:hypothetical protein
MLYLQMLKHWLDARIDLSDERGEITEKVLIVAIFAGLAIAAGAIIVAKVMGKAEGINLDG